MIMSKTAMWIVFVIGWLAVLICLAATAMTIWYAKTAPYRNPEEWIAAILVLLATFSLGAVMWKATATELII